MKRVTTKMLYITIILTVAGLAMGILDEDLQSKYLTMQHSDFIDYFNAQNYSWKIKEYPANSFSNNNVMHFDSDEQLISNIFPVLYHDPSKILHLPKHFDARRQWPHCLSIGKIFSQHQCGSCWAHGVANTASDRTCIHTGKNLEFSEQDLECSHPHHTICYGGRPADGFEYWQKYGLVPRECKPYDPLDLSRHECVSLCHGSTSINDYFNNKTYAKNVYNVPNDINHIKAELSTNGPIQAVMKVYKDFHPNPYPGYISGIYEHKYGDFLAFHSVRVIGYGVEDGVDYWLVANSWGRGWGENGFFRIKAYQEDNLIFEQSMISGVPRK